MKGLAMKQSMNAQEFDSCEIEKRQSVELKTQSSDISRVRSLISQQRQVSQLIDQLCEDSQELEVFFFRFCQKDSKACKFFSFFS